MVRMAVAMLRAAFKDFESDRIRRMRRYIISFVSPLTPRRTSAIYLRRRPPRSVEMILRMGLDPEILIIPSMSFIYSQSDLGHSAAAFLTSTNSTAARFCAVTRLIHQHRL